MSDKVPLLRRLLDTAEWRSADRAAFTTILQVAEADARWFYDEVVALFGGKLIQPETEADIERALHGYIERSALALREGGATDTEVAAYVGGFALAFSVRHDEMQAELRKAATVGMH